MDMGATGDVTMTPYRNRSQRLRPGRSRGRGPAEMPPWAGAGVSGIRSKCSVGGQANIVGESDSRVIQVSARSLKYTQRRPAATWQWPYLFNFCALLHALAS